jgi:hypothetical protein
MRKMACSIVAVLLTSVAPMAFGQAGDQKTLLLKQLHDQFVPTRFSADNSEIVTPGVVVALKKDGLLVYPVTVPMAPISVFKKDKLSQGLGDMLGVGMADGLGRPGGITSVPTKTLVTGDQIRVRAIELAKDSDSILVQVVTDPYEDGRYFGTLKFLIPKGSVPAPEDAVRAISEVLEVQQAAAPPETASAAATEVLPPPPRQYQEIAPPPPPPVPAPTVSLGEPKSKVATDLGEPQRKAVVGAKEIFFYSDPKMKITFSGGRVTNVE